MGAVEYQHHDGAKLTQKQLDIREQEGWSIVRHSYNSVTEVHSYSFRRKKDVNG